MLRSVWSLITSVLCAEGEPEDASASTSTSQLPVDIDAEETTRLRRRLYQLQVQNSQDPPYWSQECVCFVHKFYHERAAYLLDGDCRREQTLLLCA